MHCLVLQRQIRGYITGTAAVVTAAGLCLPSAPPAGPAQVVRPLHVRQGEHEQQAAHLWSGERDQVVGDPPLSAAAFAVVRVTSRKAWASRQSVMCRYQAS